jgi:hypothetical protein
MWRLWVFFVLMIISCRALTPAALPADAPESNAVLPTKPGPTPALSPTPNKASRTRSTILPTANPEPLPETSFIVQTHPDGELFVGDLVSLEVFVSGEPDLEGYSVEVQVDAPHGERLEETGFGYFGIAGREQATMQWAWDTSGLVPGEHNLTFSIQPDGPEWVESFLLAPQNDTPDPEAIWVQDKSDCCLVYTITGTDAERDMDVLLDMVDEQFQRASLRLGVDYKDAMTITFLPRVLGHGGFARDEISVSYLDRNYAGGDPEVILHHEMVHLLDASLGGELRPSLMIEGLAVYLTGGHFKPESLMPRAAALLPPVDGCVQASTEEQDDAEGEICGLDWYLPLVPLVDNFYTSAHEIGYLQAGAMVEFMVETWGWEAFSAFYRDIQPSERSADESQGMDVSQALALDEATRAHFGLTLEALEARYLEALSEETLKPDLVEDVRLTVAFYDTVRRYQKLLDPSAHFLTAWLPDGAQMRERGIVADYLRRPTEPENIALETMLVAADEYLRNGDYARVEKLLEAINAALDALEDGG